MKKINHETLNKIASVAVFSIEGAIEAYKNIVKYFCDHVSMESGVVVSKAAEDMHKIGFTWEEIEALEIEALA